MGPNSQNSLILNSSKFQRLVSIRTKTRFFLSALTLVTHAFFVGGIAFYRDFFATPLSDGGTITIGIASAASVIVLMLLLEFFYILISRKIFDPLQAECMSEAASNV